MGSDRNRPGKSARAASALAAAVLKGDAATARMLAIEIASADKVREQKK